MYPIQHFIAEKKEGFTWAQDKSYNSTFTVHRSASSRFASFPFSSFLQVGLGIATLLWFVPTPLAASHQSGSLALLTFALWLMHELKKKVPRLWNWSWTLMLVSIRIDSEHCFQFVSHTFTRISPYRWLYNITPTTWARCQHHHMDASIPPKLNLALSSNFTYNESIYMTFN